MKLMCEKIVNTGLYAGRADVIIAEKEPISEVKYDDITHTYTLGGEELPSVTSLLDDGSYQSVDSEILKKAQERGTLIHNECQAYIERKEMGQTNEFNAFKELWDKMYDKLKKPCIVDFKTYSSNDLKKQKKCYNQCNMYAKGHEYLTGEKITQFYEIHLPKNGDAELIDLTMLFGDTTPAEIKDLSLQVEMLENKLIAYNEIVKQRDDLKEQLRQKMTEYDIKSWKTPNGITITNIADGEDKTVKKFNEDKFKEENENLYNNYLEDKIQKGRKGSLRITMPKGE